MKPCILPWINFGTSIFGRPRICGYSDSEKQWEQMFRERNLPWPPTPIEETPEYILTSNFAKEYMTWINKLEKSNIEEQWNGLYFKEIRKSFLNNDCPKYCKRCKHVEELNV